jgi:hypothetical protein
VISRRSSRWTRGNSLHKDVEEQSGAILETLSGVIRLYEPGPQPAAAWTYYDILIAIQKRAAEKPR